MRPDLLATSFRILELKRDWRERQVKHLLPYL